MFYLSRGVAVTVTCPSTFQFPGPCACEAVLLFVHHAIIPCDADDEVKVDDIDIDIDKRCDSINYNLSASIIALLQQTGVGIDYTTYYNASSGFHDGVIVVIASCPKEYPEDHGMGGVVSSTAAVSAAMPAANGVLFY
eukprot:scaffold96059_cov32-Attheya_sp.AAC.2